MLSRSLVVPPSEQNLNSGGPAVGCGPSELCRRVYHNGGMEVVGLAVGDERNSAKRDP